MTAENYKGFDTIALHGGQTIDKDTNSRAVPIYQTSSYTFNSAEHAANLFELKEFGNIYTRLMNPTTDVLEKRIAALEGGSGALATASGMAAEMLAITNICKAGDEVLSSSTLYGGTHNLFKHTLPKLGINVNFAPHKDLAVFKCALTKNTKAVYVESLGNPKLDVADIEALAKIAHDAGIPLIVDNTMTTPYMLKPFEYGADIVVHSLTKFICGHGSSMGGIIVDSGNFKWDNGNFPDMVNPDPSYHGIKFYETFGNLPGMGNIAFIIKARVQGLRDQGACLSPFNSFLILQGLETLSLRMERHSQNGMAVAKYLKGHKKVEFVNYPGLKDNSEHEIAKKYFQNGFGGMVCFGVKGGLLAGKKVLENVNLFYHATNLGDSRSVITHPASTTHQQLSEEDQMNAGVSPSFIRLSVGIENIEDIIDDLDFALSKV
jgi:O-acetylhomoserine (thiol)-lyase